MTSFVHVQSEMHRVPRHEWREDEVSYHTWVSNGSLSLHSLSTPLSLSLCCLSLSTILSSSRTPSRPSLTASGVCESPRGNELHSSFQIKHNFAIGIRRGSHTLTHVSTRDDRNGSDDGWGGLPPWFIVAAITVSRRGIFKRERGGENNNKKKPV